MRYEDEFPIAQEPKDVMCYEEAARAYMKRWPGLWEMCEAMDSGGDNPYCEESFSTV